MTSLGLVLLVIGTVVAIGEAHYPTHGIAGGAGVLIMAIGAVLALSSVGASILLALACGVILAAAGAGVLAAALKRGLATRQLRVRTGAEGMIGHIGVVRSWTDGLGSVDLDGAVWRARRSEQPGDAPPELHPGDPVVVERLTGLTLSVRPAEEWELL
jgi:membrane-bound serine protease (ClpP class)